MSTRCQIGFYSTKEAKLEEFEALIYRHSDGYPGNPEKGEYGVLQDIIPFLEWWHVNRGMDDVEYLSARLVQWLCNEYDGISLINHYSQAEDIKKYGFTGESDHGICNNFHGDIEYYYAISPGLVRVYDVGWDEPCRQWKLIKEINIGGKK